MFLVLECTNAVFAIDSYILKVPFENYSEDGIIYVWIGRWVHV